jgi:hypothetical protein
MKSLALRLVFSAVLAAAVCCGPPGCADNAEGVEQAGRAALDYKESVDAVVAAIEAREISHADAAGALATVLRPEHAVAVSQAADPTEVAKSISEQVGVYARLALAHAEHLRSLSQNEGPGTLEGFTSIVHGLTPLLGPYGVIAGTVLTGIGLIFGKKSGFKAGEVSGASKVASIADVDKEVFDTVNSTHPQLASAVLEYRDWHLDQPAAQ